MMRTPIAALVASLLVATVAGAQQIAGRVSNPTTSPVLPDIVAFDRIENDRQELRFMRLSSQQEFSSTKARAAPRRGIVVTLPDITGGASLSSYAGQLDWRPVADQGRSWFAYVASDDRGTVGLMLNYIDGNGQLANSDPVRIPFSGQARSPRWAPDGQHLAFVSDSSVLFIVSGVGAALRGGNAGSLTPTRITAATRPALFPAWSPFGDHIAYGVETVSRGNRNGAIEVLPVNKLTGKVAGTPVIVTSELIGDNEYRPSWSSDGKYIAFYADQSGMGGSAQKVSVGIVEVVLNARSGQVFRGVVKEGRQRWLADNVLPDEVRGPAWSSITDGGQRKDALLYVLRDPARNNPIAVASFQRFIDQVPRAQYESEMSAGWNAVNPKSVSSTEINYKLRFVYAEVKGGGDVIGFHDAVAMWAKGPDPVVVLAARGAGGTPPPQDEGPIVIYAHKGKDVGQAILFPGLGQFSSGNKSKGLVLMGAGVAGAVWGGLGFVGLSDPVSKGKAAVVAISRSRDPSTITAERKNYDDAKKLYDSQLSKVTVGGLVYALAWAFGVGDAAFGSPPAAPGLSVRVVPDITTAYGMSGRLGFTIPIGSNRH